LSAMVWSAHR